MLQNQSAIQASKNNLLHSKARTFRSNYSESFRRTQSKSNIHTLAHTVYSNNKYNKEFLSPVKRSASRVNPEHNNSTVALKNLDIRVSHIPNMSDINTELLMEKRQLQQHILFLKDQTAKQTRSRNKADTNWRLARNAQQTCNEAYQQQCRKSSKLNEHIIETKNQNYHLRCEISKLHQENQDTSNEKMQEGVRVDELQNRVNTLKSSLMMQEKARNHVKLELVKQQRVMSSFAIESKELQNERAMLMLEINQTVLKHKL